MAVTRFAMMVYVVSDAGLPPSLSVITAAAVAVGVIMQSIALSITTRTLFHSNTPVVLELGIAGVSLASCLLQFYLGRQLSKPYGETLTGGQAMGQKSAILEVWMGYTFLSPITSLAGGFYSIWHNVVNSWQLYQKKKEQ